MPNSPTSADVRPGTRRGNRLGWWLAALLLFIAVVAVAFTAYQAVQARAAMKDAAVSLREVRDAVAEHDTDRARAALQEAQASTETARDNTRGPVWWLGSQLPVLGDDVSAVRTVTEVGDELTHQVMPGLVEASEHLSPADLQPTNGRINIDAVEQAAPAVVRADRALEDGAARVAAIDVDGLIDQLAGPVADLQQTLGDVDSVTSAAAKAVQLIPPMLGSEGERKYLVLFQNNAEPRATGGIPGAFAVLTARDGRIDLGRQGTAGDLGQFRRAVLPLTEDEVQLFDAEVAAFSQDINFTPDFPRTGQFAQEMWRRSSGMTVDGVISTDPVGLSYLLEGTGPVEVPGGLQLTADNAVQTLLSDVYLTVDDQEQQNALFALAAREVFDALASGQGDPKAVLEALTNIVHEDRLLVWSAHAEEQEILSGTPVAGDLPEAPGEQPHIGMYVNDGTAAKMGYYLDYDVRVEATSCDDDGRQDLRAEVVLKSDAPEDAASLPAYVTGANSGVEPGNIRINVLLYAPFDGKVQGATLNGETLQFAALDHHGRPVAAQTLDVAPGQEHHLVFDIVSGPGQTGEPEVRVTPGAQRGDDSVVSDSACG